MKKLLFVVCIIAALFCLTACPSPSGGGRTGSVDTTTLDGYYVETVTFAGKPVNNRTIIISGNTIKLYRAIGPTSFSSRGLPIEQRYFGSYSIIRNGLSFEIGGDTITMKTENGVTFLEGYVDQEPVYMEKVPAGTTGRPLRTCDVYLNNNQVVQIMYNDTHDEQIDLIRSNMDRYTSMEVSVSGQTHKVTGVAYGTYDQDDGTWKFLSSNRNRSTTFTVTVSGNTAEVSSLSSAPPGLSSAAGTYTKYESSARWPVAPAN